jgi:hypothetical protein
MGSALKARLFEARCWNLGEDPKLSLAVEMLQCHGAVQLRAWGTSMLPIIWPGDLVTIESAAPNELIPGDILLLLRDKSFFLHRLVERSETENSFSWITRGDAMPQNDPPTAASQILGRLVRIDRGDDCGDDRPGHRNNARTNRTILPARRVSQIQLAIAWIQFRLERVRNLVWSSRRGVRFISQSGASPR